jgi:outer membrane immunogenic protein
MTKIKKELVAGGLTAVAAAVAGAQAVAAADMLPPEQYGPDWSGVYLGVGAGMIFGGDFPVTDLSSDYDADNEFVFGGFIGVNHQLQDSNVVIGAELAVQSGFDSDGGSPDHDYQVNFLADAKVKLGWAMDNVMPYVFGGFSAAHEEVGSSDYDYGLWGVNYGVGVDWMVSDNFSLGAELLGRSIQDPYNEDNSQGDSQSHWQGMLRASFHFD